MGSSGTVASMLIRLLNRFTACFALLVALSCGQHPSSNEEMIQLLHDAREKYNHFDNYYASAARVRHFDSVVANATSEQDKMIYTYDLARALVSLGREPEATLLLEEEVRKIDREGIQGMTKLKALLALAHLRDGERNNCITNHSAETCILPIRGSGIHENESGSRDAIRIYQELLRTYPDNLEYRWLMNIAFMTVGEYPAGVPAQYLVPGLDAQLVLADSAIVVKPFYDVAGALGLQVNNMAGGSIIDDFDNDGYLDLVTSGWDLDDAMHFFHNNADGTFKDQSRQSGLQVLTGGLNLLQADFNNDGFTDVLVLRGAWLRDDYGMQPNSLLRNNGDGTFTDITSRSGMLSFHPTQTATWNDFNNDGWVDLFIGNETWSGNKASGTHPCELYINNRDETFVNVADAAQCDVRGFVKGVTSGDYDNDGWQDLFISTLSGERYLLRNKGVAGMVPSFEDVTHRTKLDDKFARTFPTWFWDFDNDGWLDIFVGDFTFDDNITQYPAAEALGMPTGNSGAPILYRNNSDGSFSNVSVEAGLNRTAFAMGANFGDIDNDGFLDFYLGTGNPEIESVVPNKLFKNIGGKRYVDITTPSRTGHLQKGHAISFADIDHDGDQDIHIEMGGAYKGDAFFNSFFLNPGQDEMNNWIAIELEGTKANRKAIGSRIRLSFEENGIRRSVYRDVNSGGSFGASPLRKEIGVGRTSLIDTLEIRWHPGGVQIIRNIEPNRFIRVKQGVNAYQEIMLKRLDLNISSHAHSH